MILVRAGSPNIEMNRAADYANNRNKSSPVDIHPKKQPCKRLFGSPAFGGKGIENHLLLFIHPSSLFDPHFRIFFNKNVFVYNLILTFLGNTEQ